MTFDKACQRMMEKEAVKISLSSWEEDVYLYYDFFTRKIKKNPKGRSLSHEELLDFITDGREDWDVYYDSPKMIVNRDEKITLTKVNQYKEAMLEEFDKEFKEWVCDDYTIEELFNSPKIKECLKECFGSYFVEEVLPV